MTAYTGIGARKTPISILKRMTKFGEGLGQLGLILRSGGADGADTAFELGCDVIGGHKEIFLPWKGFNKKHSHFYKIPEKAFEIAADVYGPSWLYIKRSIKLFMARNIQQVLGKNLDDPSDFVITWTPDGCKSQEQRSKETGGTGQAIACASERGIPVFNLKNEGAEKEFLSFVEEMFND